GKGREQRPPQDDSRQHSPRAQDIAQPAAGHFEQAVTERERAEHQSHVHIGEAEVILHLALDPANADTIEIGQNGQAADESQHAEADLRGIHGWWDGLVHWRALSEVQGAMSKAGMDLARNYLTGKGVEQAHST